MLNISEEELLKAIKKLETTPHTIVDIEEQIKKDRENSPKKRTKKK